MERRFNNIGLKNDSIEVLTKVDNIGEVKIGDLSGHSIDIEFIDPPASSSYTYYDDKKSRDEDFKLLNEFLYQKI